MKESNHQTAEIVNRGNTLYLRMSQPQPKTKRSRFWIGVSLAGLAILVMGYSINSCQSTPPRFLPNGTVIVQPQTLGYGKLVIDNGTERDAVVKLVAPTDKRAIASVYVRTTRSHLFM
jgi:hypothetical protein